MTIRLLSTYDGFSPNDIITIDSALEASFIAAGNATADLTGGIVAYRERQPVMIQPAVKKRGSVSLIANRRAIVPLSAGSTLTITPGPSATGTYQRYDASGAAVGPLAVIGALGLTIGALDEDSTVEVKCATGSLVAKTADAVLSANASVTQIVNAPCTDTAVSFYDVSGNLGDIVVDKANTGAFANAGYMSSIAGTAAGCVLPAEKFAWNPAKESLIISFVLKKAAPGANQTILGICASSSAGYTGAYISHRTSGALKIVPVINGNNTNIQPDSTLSYSDATPQDRVVTIALNALDGSWYMYRDGQLSDAFKNTMIGASAYPDAVVSKPIRFGGLSSSVDATVAAQFSSVQIFKIAGDLPVNMNRIAKRLARNPSQQMLQSDFIFPTKKIIAAVLGQSNEAGGGGGSPTYISFNNSEGSPSKDPLPNGAGGTAGTNSPWPRVQAAAGKRGVWMDVQNTAYGSTSLTDVWVGKCLSYAGGMVVAPGAYILDPNGRVYKAIGALGSVYVLNTNPATGVGTSGLTSWTDLGVAGPLDTNGYVYRHNDGTGRFDPNGRMALLVSALAKPGYETKQVHIYIGQGDKTTNTTRQQYGDAMKSAAEYLTGQGIHVFLGMTISAGTVDAWFQAQLIPGRSDALAAMANNPLVHAGFNAASALGILPNEATAQPAAFENYAAIQNNGGTFLHGNSVLIGLYAAGIDAANAAAGF